MIPAPNTLVLDDNIPGERIEFGIGDARWVMKTQADLYSDITTAIIREYSTNAFDAHVMAGNPDPIQVTLPSMMNNNMFTVEDKGVGMDIDIFRRVYTQFGVSDKRGSNDTNGMLGYGSKSGIAYTTRFEVTSVKNGVKTHGIIQRDADWSIHLKVVSQVKTDEPNGTRIRIPVHNTDEFNHKAMEFYKFWLPGRVLVNGKEPEHYVGEKIADNLYYSNEWNTSYVVMGNVAYRIANPAALFANTKMNRLNFVAYVDNFQTEDGSAPVEFTPSREDLKYTDRTKATLQAIIDQFETDIIATAQTEIESSATHAEAFLAWKKWVDVLGREMFSDLEFKGDKFQSDFNIIGQRYRLNYSYGTTVVAIRNWQVESMPKTMVVTEFDVNMSSSVKKRVNQYAKMQGWNLNYILFTRQSASQIDSVWITKDKFVTWEDLKDALPKAAPKPRSIATGPRRIKGTFDYFTKAGKKVEQPLPEDVELFYITVQDEKRQNVPEILRAMDSDAYVVILAANRINKFMRENPEVKEFMAHARAQVVIDAATLLSEEAKTVRAIPYDTREWVSALDVSKVDDPKIKEIADLIKNEKELCASYDSNMRLAQWVGMRYDVKAHRDGVGFNIVERYPLLTPMRTYNFHEHVYTYLNAVHAAEKENKND